MKAPAIERANVERLRMKNESRDVSIVVADCKELESKISFHYMQIIERLKGQIESYKFTL